MQAKRTANRLGVLEGTRDGPIEARGQAGIGVEQEDRVSAARFDPHGELLGSAGGAAHDARPGRCGEFPRGIPAAAIDHDHLDTGCVRTLDRADDPIGLV